MQYMFLGKTDLKVSEVGFGCIPIIRLSHNDAVKTLRYALDRGITFYDTANAYKDSEEKIGIAFEGKRNKVVLATKTSKRDAKSAMADLENSLRMMKTDYIDLYQLHQISKEEVWEQATGPSGVLEAVLKAQEQGKIRYIGVTSHNRQMAIKLTKTNIFSTVQFPFNFIEEAAKDDLFPEARKLGMGMLAMKPFAGGVIDNATIAFKFLRQYSDVLCIPGLESVEGVDEIISLYEQPNEVSEEDLELMERYKQELGKEFCRRCEYCQPCPHKVNITPAMGYWVMAKRMSPKVAVEFQRKVMETVPNCVECGQCIERCPYELEIPQFLRRNYEMWVEHQK